MGEAVTVGLGVADGAGVALGVAVRVRVTLGVTVSFGSAAGAPVQAIRKATAPAATRPAGDPLLARFPLTEGNSERISRNCKAHTAAGAAFARSTLRVSF